MDNFKEFYVGENSKKSLKIASVHKTVGEALEAQHRRFKKYQQRLQVIGVTNGNEVKIVANRLPKNF